AIGDDANGTATVEVILATPPYSILWNTDPVQTTPTAVDLAAGTYTVTVTDGRGCTEVIDITVDQLTSTIPRLSDDRLQVFPNPSEGDVNILLEGVPTLKGEFQLTDALGRVCRKGAIRGSRSQQLEGLPPGLYLLSVQILGKLFTRKVLIQ
ncbi:MAG TPA: T9SS type A sorting domain-containing protein, partial [Phaeodactylibacter sp.]|nr:T9SS type A sorting domain-containing protein [Phaeodactylibacter sp.]